jgi:hypothetical protein
LLKASQAAKNHRANVPLSCYVLARFKGEKRNMNADDLSKLAIHSSWPKMLGKMEQSLERLLAEEPVQDSVKEKGKGAPKAPYSAKESKLLHRLDQHLGNLEASLQRAEQLAKECEPVADEAISAMEQWLQAIRTAGKKLEPGPPISVG